VIAFTVGFGIAGAIGGAFVLPRLFWAGMVRFGLSAAVGATVASTVPSFNLSADASTPQHLVGLVAALLLGHLIPFVLGGFWFGRALEAEERALNPNRRTLGY
jgi:Na+/H+-translocating membrane pyrophosphatase